MINVRLCMPYEGPRIAEWIKDKPIFDVEQHGVFFDWTREVCSWLIAEQDGKLIGVVLLMVGPPLGMFENLVLDPECSKVTKSRVVAMFLKMGYELFRSLGCSAACYIISDANSEFREMLRKRGARRAYRGEMLVRGL